MMESLTIQTCTCTTRNSMRIEFLQVTLGVLLVAKCDLSFAPAPAPTLVAPVPTLSPQAPVPTMHLSLFQVLPLFLAMHQVLPPVCKCMCVCDMHTHKHVHTQTRINPSLIFICTQILVIGLHTHTQAHTAPPIFARE